MRNESGRHRRRPDAHAWTPEPTGADHGRHRRRNVEADEQPEVPEQPEAPDVETTDRIDGLPMALRRTTVTVLPPDRRPEAEPDPDKADLLSLYNIGTVPASVTPPASWRKAAWFAMVSSAGVIAALLVASTYLVQNQAQQTNGQQWTGWNGGGTADKPPVARHTASAPRTSAANAKAEPKKPQVIDDVVQVETSAPAAAPTPTGTRTAAPAARRSADGVAIPVRTSRPRHAVWTPSQPAPSTTPPPTIQTTPPPPARATNKAPLPLGDPKKMGDRTEAFLKEVTTNPAKALKETGGLLRMQGAQSLARRYAGIKKIDVERIYIDRRTDTTINTVRTAYTNGTVHSEQRTLRFDLSNLIVQD